MSLNMSMFLVVVIGVLLVVCPGLVAAVCLFMLFMKLGENNE